MAKKGRNDLTTTSGIKFPTNNVNLIKAKDHREYNKDIIDSKFNLIDDELKDVTYDKATGKTLEQTLLNNSPIIASCRIEYRVISLTPNSVPNPNGTVTTNYTVDNYQINTSYLKNMTSGFNIIANDRAEQPVFHHQFNINVPNDRYLVLNTSNNAIPFLKTTNLLHLSIELPYIINSSSLPFVHTEDIVILKI